MPGVIVPGRRNKDAELLGIINTGLNIASNVYGIKSAQAQLARQESADARADEQFAMQKQQVEDQRQGIITPTQKLQLEGQGFQFKPAEGPQSGALGIRTPEGNVQAFTVAPGLTPAQQGTLDISRSTAQAARARRDDDLAYRDKENLFKVQDKFRTDKVVQESSDKLNRAGVIRGLLDQNEPITDSIALNQVFRMSGDVGAIRDQDLERLGASPALMDRALLAINRLSSGQRIDDKARNSLNKAVDLIETLAKEDINRRASFFANQGSSLINGMDAEDILEQLEVESFAPPTIAPDGGPLRSTSQQNLIQPTYEVFPSITPEAKASPGGYQDPMDAYSNYLQNFNQR